MGFHGGFWREKNNPQHKAFVLRVILGDFWGLCWANVGPFWVYVGPMLGHFGGFMGFHGGFWREPFTTILCLFLTTNDSLLLRVMLEKGSHCEGKLVTLTMVRYWGRYEKPTPTGKLVR